MKKNWEYTIECDTCGEVSKVLPSDDPNEDYYCLFCVTELKRRIDSGEINIDNEN